MLAPSVAYRPPCARSRANLLAYEGLHAGERHVRPYSIRSWKAQSPHADGWRSDRFRSPSRLALTAAVVLAIVVVNTSLMGRGGSIGGIDIWFAFIKRGDILATIILTALVTTAFIYWQRDRERR